jgi:hypothetical protein
LGVNCGSASIVGSANPTTDIDGIVRVVISYDSHPVGCSVSQFFISVYDGSNTVNVIVDAGLASESAKIAGLNNDDLVKVGSSDNTTTKTLTQNSFEKLLAFVNGATFGGGLGAYTYTPPAGGGGTVTSVTSSSSALIVGGTSAAPILSLSTGTSANQLVQLDASARLPAVDGSQLTNLTVPASSITSTSGLFSYRPNGTMCATGEGLKWTVSGWVCGYQQYDFSTVTTNQVPYSSAGGFIGKAVSQVPTANTLVERDSSSMIKSNGVVINNVTLSQPTGTSYTLSLPPAGPNTGQTLVAANGSGDLQWQSGPLHIERTRLSTGFTTFTFNAPFSGNPICTCTYESATAACHITGLSNSQVQINNASFPTHIICIEP